MTTRFIVNPAAGGGRCRQRLDALRPRLGTPYADAAVVETTAPGHATALARQAVADGVTRVVVVGGDGTAFEVLNGLFPTGNAPLPELAYLPLGTGNSFARDLGVVDEDSALRVLSQGAPTPVDVLHATCEQDDFHSINLISTGFTADVGEVVNRRFKRMGAAGYAFGVLARLATLSAPVIPLQVDDAPRTDTPITLLSLSNSRCTGGTMHIAPNARIDDGRMDVICVGRMGRTRLITAFPKIYSGTHLSLGAVTADTAANVTFPDATERDWMVDGEVLRRTVHTVRILPGAVQVLR